MNYLKKGDTEMFCNACGHPNPDGSSFCSSCGKPINSISPAPVRQQNSSPQFAAASSRNGTANTQKTEDKRPAEIFSELFRRSWRELATSPFALVLIITYSVSVLLSAIELQSLFEDLDGLTELLGVLSFFGSDLFEKLDTSLTLIQLLISTPGILTALALWLLYADARDLSATRPIKTMPFTLIKGVMIGIIVAFYFCIASVLFTSCSIMAELDLNNSSARSAISGMICGLLVAAVVCGIYYRFAWNLVNTVKDSADYCTIDTSYIKGFAVYFYIAGGLSVIGMLSVGITLNLLVSCALPFMYAVMLQKYEAFMKMLYDQHGKIFGRPQSLYKQNNSLY